ncbi:MAG TPA: L,D-transpeptidase [Bacteroidales bacterium]|nr:L,D-transpeptidase [Bacteroidales bacterium]
MDELTENTIPLTGDAKPAKPEEKSSFFQNLLSHVAVRITLIIAGIVLLLIFPFCVPVYIAPALQHAWGTSRTECRADSSLLQDKSIKKQLSTTQSEIKRLERKLASFIPTSTYIVINTTDNRFSLYKSRKLIREGFCSSGSYTLLKTEDGEKEWIFKTPRGRFSIQGKITDPVWRRPDWAFVEEGLPVPSAGDASRYEYGVLGDYAMSLGDGYLIHGTIYKRFLGMPVTHGCIRLNDEDLKAVYNTLNIGSKVYIY